MEMSPKESGRQSRGALLMSGIRYLLLPSSGECNEGNGNVQPDWTASFSVKATNF